MDRAGLRDQGVDLLVGREAAKFFLGKHQLAGGEDLKHAVPTLDEFDVFSSLG